MSRFDRFENRTVLRGTLVLDAALAVGARASLRPTGSDLPVVRDSDGRPFIPGASLKGAVRAQAERVLRSLDGRPDLRACDPFDDPCAGRIGQPGPYESDAAFSDRAWAASCLACRLFGSTLFCGRLFFKDARLLNADDLPVLTQVRDGVGIDRDLGAARTGIKYDFETVVPGARFAVEVQAENVEPWELGFLLAVLRLWEEGALAIGGKVTRGPGWGRLTDLHLSRLERSTLLDYLAGAEIPTVPPADFVAAFRAHLAGEGETPDA